MEQRLSQRDVVLIPFPYSDLEQAKRRPALIISTNDYNENNEDVICCAITSNPRNYQGSVIINNNDFERGFLQYDSRVRPSKVFTLQQDRVTKVLARLNPEKSRTVVNELQQFIKIT